jgi:hypothetical protein
LHIPNYDGCFFIELERNSYVGTELKLYLNNSVDDKSIVDYIRKIMQDIKYAINIQFINEKGEEKQIYIPAHSIRKQNESEDFRFFIPFLENGEVPIVDYQKDILSDELISKYEYGLLIRKKKNLKSNNKHMILNSGIVVEQASLGSVFGKNCRRNNYVYDSYEGEETYNDIIVNFPANWLQLDVARENITGLSDVIKEKGPKRKACMLGIKIANSLYNQILEYIKCLGNQRTNIPAICLRDIIQYAIDFCGNQKSEADLRTKLERLKYILIIEFFENGVCYKIVRDEMLERRTRISYLDSNAKEQREKWLEKLHKEEIGISTPATRRMEDISELRISSREMIRLFEDTVYREDVYISDKMRFKLNHLLKDLQGVLRIEGNNKNIFGLLTLFILDMPDEIICELSKEHMSMVFILETIFLQYFSIGAEQEMKITYDELFEIIETHKTRKDYIIN